MAQCPAITNPNSAWPGFCPSLPAAYLFAVLFGATTLAHAVQMFLHRKPYSLVIVASGGLQTACYILRILSIQHPANDGYYTYWFVLMMVAPIWTNAYAYMVMGRMVYNFTPTASVFKIKAWRFGLIFVLLDVVAFFVQAAGAVIASGNIKNAMLGIHIYEGGIGFQQVCIFLFLALAIRFHQKLRLQPQSFDRKRAFQLLYIEYAVVGLITVRIIFRLIEYSNGIKSTIPRHEAYQYVFDSTLMLIALVLFNIFHPGRMMPGQESNLPSRKVRKVWKREGQEPHGRGQDTLLPRYKSVSEDFSTSGFVAGPNAAAGEYGRLATPSPSRDNSFDGRGGSLSPPNRPRSYSNQEFLSADRGYASNV